MNAVKYQRNIIKQGDFTPAMLLICCSLCSNIHRKLKGTIGTGVTLRSSMVDKVMLL